VNRPDEMARHARRRRALTTLAAGTVVAALAGCAPGTTLPSTSDGAVRVVTTTGILSDLVAHVGGDRVDVVSIVPEGADAHTYEPSLRDVRDIAYADLAFSNYLLLEEHSIIKALDANLRDGVTEVSIAEASVQYGADIIPLVEDVSLDTVWLGLRVDGSGSDLGATRSSDVRLRATGVEGPGDVFAYLTGSFGDAQMAFDSSDGFDAADGYRDDTAILPPQAHTHLSWAFTEPGVYRLDLEADVQASQEARPVRLGTTTVTFAVGVDPSRAGVAGATVVERGHTDITVDIGGEPLLAGHDHDHGEAHPAGDADGRTFSLRSEGTDGGIAEVTYLDPASTVVSVPNRALHEVPAGPGLRFLGEPGTQVHQLPQAVLGKHVHGSIDPHLWQDVRNAQAYVEVIRDALVAEDPEGAAEYRGNADAYLAELTETDDYVRDTIASIPEPRRHLVTTHDAFGYLASAYGIEISGFVTPNPASEPSLADRRKLGETIRNLEIPAVFLEPELAARSSTLTSVADDLGVDVCTIYGDAFGPGISSYIEMVRVNADSLSRCLDV